jgi:hypothetical protein
MRRKALEIPKVKKGEPVKAILFIDDELSFINAVQIREDILNNLNQFDSINIQANIVHLDLTGVQLLYSIKKTCETLNKGITYNIKMNEELKYLIARSGFIELVNI